MNCKKYNSETSCEECLEKFYLESSDKCTAVTVVEKCLHYGTTESSSKCIQCENLYFLSSDSCSTRVASLTVENCMYFLNDKDECKDCHYDYIFNADKSKCILGVENCASYNVLKCATCKNGYYLDTALNFC